MMNGNRLPWLLGAALTCCAALHANPPPTFLEPALTLDQAIALALEHRPELAEARAGTAAASGRIDDARRFPNPEAIARMEGGGTRETDYLAGVSQPIPLGRRRSAAVHYEQLEQIRLERELERLHWSVSRQVHGSFATALYAAAAEDAQAGMTEDARDLLRLSRLLVAEGEAPPGELARLEAEMFREELELARAETLRRQAFLALAASVGKPELRIASLEGSLPEILEMRPLLQDHTARIEEHPDLKQAEAAVAAEEARLALVRAGRVPDLNLDLLYRRMESSRPNGFDLGISVSLPIFNSGRGRAREAAALIETAEARAVRTRHELQQSAAANQWRYAGALDTARLLESRILPRLREAVRIGEIRYAEADISLAELLGLRRELASATLSHLEALRAALHARAALDR